MFLDPRLETLAPGPELGAVLATIDRCRLNGYDLVIVMAARARQVCYEQAQLLADIYEVSRCEPGGPHAPVERIGTVGSEQDEFAAAEISAALRLTRAAAQAQLGLAYGVAQLPAVGQAL